MHISIDWIKEFVQLPDLSPKDLGSKFTLATAEVEDVVVKNSHLKDISIVQIVSFIKHPEADKLNLVTFKISEMETKEVVCGAPNVKVGIKIPYAKIGTTLPNGLTLEPKKIRGIESHGMLCSAVELGLGEESSGIMELPSDAPLGQDMLTYLNETCDVLLDIDNKSLTHRPDLWGHYGMAREFATVFEKPLHNPFNNDWATNLKKNFNDSPAPITPEVEADSAGVAYFGLSLDNVKVTESPTWIQKRLKAVGLRPINSIVDISNYVMLELGIPLHIFDREEIKGNKVFIKKLTASEKFMTLDKIERELVAGDTVISDSEKTLVLGGIMGGLNSGVTDKTSKIFIEVANWKPALVRKSSVRLGLRTDSSQRYEKSLDSKLCERTLLRTLELVLKLNPGAKVIGRPTYSGNDLEAIKTITITTSVNRICKKLGIAVEAKRIEKILTSLDFLVENKNDELKITVPSFRSTKDVEVEDDIVEEIGRIIGFDNITPYSPQGDIKAVRLSPAKIMTRKIQDFMVMKGEALEVMTYPLTGDKVLLKAQWPTVNDALALVNPVSIDHDRMRPSLVPQFLNLVSENIKNYDEFRCFEIGRSYLPDEKTFSTEKNQLVVAFYSKEKNHFIELENLMERLLTNLNISFDWAEINPKFKNIHLPNDWVGAHPHEYQNLRIMGQNHGVVASIHPLILREFKIKGHLHLAIIDLSTFENKETKDKTKYNPLPKFPSSEFDCTVVTDKNLPVVKVMDALKNVKLKEIADRRVLDVYNLNDSQKTVTIRIVFYDSTQTLSSDFLKHAGEQVVAALTKAGFPLKA
ncbi:MAG: phenylalanine--tRNA ligase subunit beta [Bacteriovoracaceae bacterium]